MLELKLIDVSKRGHSRYIDEQVRVSYLFDWHFKVKTSDIARSQSVIER